jgi:small subunit ribosomal protein S17
MELLPHEARKRTKVGTVVSDKMDKTVVVAVENIRRHRLYGRSIRRTKKYHAHDEQNSCKLGDRVIIAESRPLSRTKRWSVREILGHNVVAGLPKVKDPDVSTPPRTDPTQSPPLAERPRASGEEGDDVRGVADADEE